MPTVKGFPVSGGPPICLVGLCWKDLIHDEPGELLSSFTSNISAWNAKQTSLV